MSDAGTVALATVRGVQNVRVARVGSAVPWWVSFEPVPVAIRGTVYGQCHHPDEAVTDVRPLRVIEDVTIDTGVPFFDHEEDGQGEPTIWLVKGTGDPLPMPVLSLTDLQPDVRHLWPVVVDALLSTQPAVLRS